MAGATAPSLMMRFIERYRAWIVFIFVLRRSSPCFAVLRRVAASLPAPRLYIVRSCIRVSLISIPFFPFHRLHVSKRVLPASPWHSGLLCLSTSDYTQTPRVTTLDRQQHLYMPQLQLLELRFASSAFGESADSSRVTWSVE